jgi:hypothetical protein
MIMCRLLGLTKTYHIRNGLSVPEHQYYKNRSVSIAWPWVQFLDVVILVNLRVKLLLWRGFTVVCDRFVPDILVELMTDVDDSRLHEKLIGRLILRTMPEPIQMVLLYTDEKTAWERKNDVPELGYLIRRKNEYRQIGRDLKIPMINAEGSIVSVQRSLKSLIG